ncbi:hypothetical protein SAMN02745157_1510 [Kaistia soli DSM 19436]|uniref:Uncharacterized protein n=1 Tax=Kaistia soli DSM 19436 TaxID=1122133 RepID=A0A1M4YG17_9HYPH|nr:hypothetical protein [Kaistia soli]SHF04619.1 hypothetical protein SAMN02745157_1510 [Kaistia soli DSM 19436]
MSEDNATSLATRKFEFEDIVNADPLCPPAALKVVRAYLGFIKDFERDAVYRSLIDLQVATGLSRRHLIDTRRLLIKLGYLEEAAKSRTGVARYRFRKPRENLVLDHQLEAREKLREIEAERQESQRLRRRHHVSEDSSLTTPDPVSEDSSRTQAACECRNLTYVSEDSAPNYLEEYLEDSLSEQEGSIRIEDTREPGDGSQHVPYPPPQTVDDLEQQLADLFDGCQLSPNLLVGMRKLLIAGRLTPAIVAQQRKVAS